MYAHLCFRCDALLKPSSAVSEFAVYFAGGKLHGVNGDRAEGGGSEKGNKGNVWEMQFITGYNERKKNDGEVGKKAKTKNQRDENPGDSSLKEDVSGSDDVFDPASQPAYIDAPNEHEMVAGTGSRVVASRDDIIDSRQDNTDKGWVPLEVSPADLLSDSKVRFVKIKGLEYPTIL